jgi:hypothetical protein
LDDFQIVEWPRDEPHESRLPEQFELGARELPAQRFDEFPAHPGGIAHRGVVTRVELSVAGRRHGVVMQPPLFLFGVKAD